MANPRIEQGDNQCRELLSYIYKDVTLKNMANSLERLNQKMLVAFLSAIKNGKSAQLSPSEKAKLKSLLKSLEKVDPDLKHFLQEESANATASLALDSNAKKKLYPRMIKEWMALQKAKPELFKDLNKQHKIDEWDIRTSELLQGYSDYKISDPLLSSHIAELANQYSENLQNLYDIPSSGALGATPLPSYGVSLSLNKTQLKIESLERAFNSSAQKIFWASLDDFKDACALGDLNAFMEENNLSCPYRSPDAANLELDEMFDSMANIISSDFMEESSPDFVKTARSKPNYIDVVPYQFQNINYDGNFCERTPALAETVVIHHSATSSKETPQELHDLQVVTHERDRDSAGNPDPWYMIAYNYLITAPYQGSAKESEVVVYQGRSDQMKGAHAGASININQLDQGTQELLETEEIKCGWNRDQDPAHSIDEVSSRSMDQMRNQIRQGYISANITSVGVLVVGNYAPDIIGRSANPGGYPANGPVRYPSEELLRSSAKLICKMRSENYPNLRKITDHNYIKIKKAIADGTREYGSCCPGTVYKRMDRLLALTKEECPEYNFILDISPEDKLCSFLKDI